MSRAEELLSVQPDFRGVQRECGLVLREQATRIIHELEEEAIGAQTGLAYLSDRNNKRKEQIAKLEAEVEKRKGINRDLCAELDDAQKAYERANTQYENADRDRTELRQNMFSLEQEAKKHRFTKFGER